jgi:hypothetical protein
MHRQNCLVRMRDVRGKSVTVGLGSTEYTLGAHVTRVYYAAILFPNYTACKNQIGRYRDVKNTSARVRLGNETGAMGIHPTVHNRPDLPNFSDRNTDSCRGSPGKGSRYPTPCRYSRAPYQHQPRVPVLFFPEFPRVPSYLRSFASLFPGEKRNKLSMFLTVFHLVVFMNSWQELD